MKKLMFLVAASLFVFAACSSEDDSDRRNWNPDAGV